MSQMHNTISSIVIDSGLSKALEQQLQNVQKNFDSVSKDFIGTSEKSKLHNVQKEVDSVRRKELTERFKEERRKLKGFEKSFRELDNVEGKQSQELGEAGRQVLQSSIEFVEDYLLSRKITSNINITRNFQEGLLEWRNKAERMYRLTQLTFPSNRQEFEAAIMWASEQGENIELVTLQTVNSNLPYSSDNIKQLIDCAEKKIRNRLKKEAKEYKVFCSQEQLERYFQGVKIVDSEPDFTIVTVLRKTIADIKLLFPVEILEPSVETQSDGRKSDDALTSHRKEDVKAAITEAFAFANIKDHQPNKAFQINQTYILQVGIRGEYSSNNDKSVQIFNDPIQLQIIVWAEGIEIEPNWITTYWFSCTKENSVAEFQLKPTQTGHTKIRVEFLYQRNWLTKVELDTEVGEAPAFVDLL